MDQAGDFESDQGIGEAVDSVDAGRVLEAETVLTQQGRLEGEALGVGTGQGTEVTDGPVHMSQRHAEGDPTPGVIRVQIRQVFEDENGLLEVAEFIPGDAEVQQEIGGVRGSGPA
jgi:hypothetical protein